METLLPEWSAFTDREHERQGACARESERCWCCTGLFPFILWQSVCVVFGRGAAGKQQLCSSWHGEVCASLCVCMHTACLQHRDEPLLQSLQLGAVQAPCLVGTAGLTMCSTPEHHPRKDVGLCIEGHL